MSALCKFNRVVVAVVNVSEHFLCIFVYKQNAGTTVVSNIPLEDGSSSGET